MRRRIRCTLMMALACMLCVCLSVPAFADESASQVATSDEYGGREELAADGMVAVDGAQVADGTYSILVETDTQMFNIIDCQLTVEGGEMSAVITLSGDGYQWVYLGTGEQAAAADSSEYVEYVEDEQGRYTYDIGQIPALNTPVKCCCYSKRREQWYDHDIIFVAGTLPDDALSAEAQEAVRESSPLSGLADGDYLIAVDVFGGDDTAESPAPLAIADGEATATLRFSSPNYERIVMTGEEYEPVEVTGDSAVFEIPVRVFDTSIPVTFSTAESEAAGSLSFHSGQVTDAAGERVSPEGDAAAGEPAASADDEAADAQAAAQAEQPDAGSVPVVAIVALIAVLCIAVGIIAFARKTRAGADEGGR